VPTVDAPTFTAQPSKPTLKLPAGACDAHVHVFGPGARFAYDAGRATQPADALKETLFALHDFLGIERCVIVHTAAHGFDNGATADALAVKGGAYRGIALVPTSISDSELKALDAAGFWRRSRT
jgi:2-pyrone-4,6-dicarboxylate lactonase